MALFGIETEYGISVEGRGAGELVAESRAVVNAYAGTYAAPWLYRNEDPRSDMRGFRVGRLNHDPNDAKFDEPHSAPVPAEQERADHVLPNGARLYNDHGHPEYGTPECSTLAEAVAHDKAGERIVLECARSRAQKIGADIAIFKNNTDFHGSSYGCHESYLMSRERPFGEVIAGLIPFFTTRILFGGAGKVGVEPNGQSGIFQLSQRADFFSEEASVDTLHRRPIVNTRDEPHADPHSWRRLHVICGDANMSEYATALKLGATSIVVALLESGWSPGVRLKNPVQTIKDLSRDQEYKWLCETADGTSISAIDIQRMYIAAGCERLSGSSQDTDWTLKEWSETLDQLERDPAVLSDRLDWVAKRGLLADFIDSEGLSWGDPIVQSFDLAYSNVDPNEGLYYALEQSGEMRRLSTDAAIVQAVTAPPATTRAALRGAVVSRFAENIGGLSWGSIVLRSGGESWMVDLAEYLGPGRVEEGLQILRESASLDDLLRRFRPADQ